MIVMPIALRRGSTRAGALAAATARRWRVKLERRYGLIGTLFVK